MGGGWGFEGFDDGGLESGGFGQAVPTGLHGFNPFGGVADGDGGSAQHIGFFLQAAAVGDDDSAGIQQRNHVQEANRINRAHIAAEGQPKFAHHFLQAGGYPQHDRQN